MSKLTADDLIKIAKSSPKGRDFVLHLAKVANGDSSSEFDETPPAMNTEQLETDKASLPSQSPEKQAQPPVAVPQENAMPMEPTAPAPEGPEAAGARAAQSFIGPEVMQRAVSGDPAAQDLVARTAGQVAGAVTEAAARATAPVTGPTPEEGVAPPAEGATMVDQGVVAPGVPIAPAVSTPEEDLANEIVPPASATPTQVPPVPGGQLEQPVQPGQEKPVPGGEQPAPAPAPQGGEQGAIDQGKGPETVVNPQPGGAPAEAGGGEKVDMNDVKKLLELARAGKI